METGKLRTCAVKQNLNKGVSHTEQSDQLCMKKYGEKKRITDFDRHGNWYIKPFLPWWLPWQRFLSNLPCDLSN